ncbi:hypothetical protein Q0590_00255 [Rhodocytophaga aerolata]|uniref:Uncharacterized protein n=1 Tax=Rhodocytophaga aerolata TaxID=455078 RepID=A0ABT8R1Z5_9BACT|nr:hypothetical protein [Rhodocytophaga aerolata]MDO1444655.1 hypothetical protein [Rhodocytophaga aerolata]
MSIITKEDIIHAFQTNQRKRNLLLYTFYKDTYFSQGFTAKFIAAKLSKELGLPISENMVFLIFHRIAKKNKELKTAAAPINSSPINKFISHLQGKEKFKANHSSEVFEFKNADEYPKSNPFEQVLKNI